MNWLDPSTWNPMMQTGAGLVFIAIVTLACLWIQGD